MIRAEEVFKIGYITRGRGLRGEVEMHFTDDCFDHGEAEYLVLDMDGILVPFFWEEYRFKNAETVILKFEDVDDEARANRLVGQSVFYPKAYINDKGATGELPSYRALTGFSVSNKTGERLGEIVAVDDSSQNILLTIRRPDETEVLIPFHNDFLLDFDLAVRTLQLNIPDELLTLND